MSNKNLKEKRNKRLKRKKRGKSQTFHMPVPHKQILKRDLTEEEAMLELERIVRLSELQELGMITTEEFEVLIRM